MEQECKHMCSHQTLIYGELMDIFQTSLCFVHKHCYLNRLSYGQSLCDYSQYSFQKLK